MRSITAASSRATCGRWARKCRRSTGRRATIPERRISGPSRPLPFVDLFQVMAQMGQIVLDQKPQRDGIAGADAARHVQHAVWYASNRVGQMTIVERPELDQVQPGTALRVLRAHPGVLLVSGKDETAAKLRADEALMVVRRRVDQMAEDFLEGPDLRRPLGRCDLL